MRKNFWITKSTKLVSQNPWFSVHKDVVTRPDGKAGEYNWLKFDAGVSALPIDEKNNIYLSKEYLYPFKKFLIQTAVGGVHRGENPLKAAKRELSEELGIEGKTWIDLGVYYFLTSYGKISLKPYLVRDLTFGKQKLDLGEVIKPFKISLKKALELISENKIEDVSTAFHILKLKHYLEFKESK